MITTNNDGATGSTVNRLASSAHNAVDSAADATRHAADSLARKGRQADQLKDKWLENIAGYVNDNPVQSLGIAAAAGFVLSKIFSSR